MTLASAQHAALATAWVPAALAYLATQALLALYASHRYFVLWRWRRPPRSQPHGGADASRMEALPCVTVQLPVYNESRVVGRLIDAAASLLYPAGRLEIQVLDDSTDETREHAAAAVAHHRSLGVDIHHLHRPRREGYKAGALAHGLARARGDVVAVFDADFVPPPDFLLRLVPHFADPTVGMVQARWGHLNRSRSALTAAQGTLLDAHFMIEHQSRMRAGLFFNFNGTAGLWRRACIADSGGWSDDTLTEDLDLSYRAQLRGWRFVFDEAVEAPAELPADMEALKSQQRRWTRGSIQTARKLLPRVWRAPLPMRVKVEAFFHLTANLSFPLVVVLGLLLLPALLVPTTLPPSVVLAIQASIIALGVVPVGLFLAAGRRASGGRWWEVLRDVPSALVLCVGLSLNNALAVFQGLGPRVGDWERTPKTGDLGRGSSKSRRYPSARRLAGRSELGLAAWFAFVGVFAWRSGHPGALPFAALLASGFCSVGLASLRASRASRRAAAAWQGAAHDPERFAAT